MGQAAANAGAGMDLEELISTFRTESQALESRYQSVRAQVEGIMIILSLF